VASVLTAVERRGAARRRAAHLGFATPAVLRPGVTVAVIELSAGGALVESAAPVRPGACTELGLDAFDGRRYAVPARVVRCWVSALGPLRYRCAVRFDDALTPG
jgi:PilZ domain